VIQTEAWYTKLVKRGVIIDIGQDGVCFVWINENVAAIL